MRNTWSKLLRTGVMALAFAVVLLLGASLPLQAQADRVPDEFIQVSPTEIIYGDALNLIVMVNDEQTGAFSATINGYEASEFMRNVVTAPGTYNLKIESTNPDVAFGDDGVYETTITLKAKLLTLADVEPTADTITYGQSRSNDLLRIVGGYKDAGCWSWESLETWPPDAGTYNYPAYFSTYWDTDLYTIDPAWGGWTNVQLIVKKATIGATEVPFPSDIPRSIVYGKMVSELATLVGDDRGTFSWVNPDTVLDAGLRNVIIEYRLKPEYAKNYQFDDGKDFIRQSYDVDVQKAPLDSNNLTWPTASAITYGQKVSESALSWTTDAVYGGTYAWSSEEKDKILPAGNGSANVVYTPSENYELAGDGKKALDIQVNSLDLDSTITFTTGSTIQYDTQDHYNDILSRAVVTSSGRSLQKDVDYTLEVSDESGTKVSSATDAGVYTVTASAVANSNYTGTATGTFEITKAPVDKLTATTSSKVYYDRTNWYDVVTGDTFRKDETKLESGSLTVPVDDYVLSAPVSMIDADEYTITATVNQDSNFTGSATMTFTVLKCSLSLFNLDNGSKEKTYDGNTQDPANLSSTLSTGTMTLEADEYTLKCDETILNVKSGGYAVRPELTEKGKKNFEMPADVGLADYFMVNPATVSSLTLTTNSSVFNDEEIALSSLEAELKATADNDVEIDVPKEVYELTCSETLKDAKDYTITVALKPEIEGVGNFQMSNDPVEDTYTITPAKVTEVTLTNGSSVYNPSVTIDPADLTATVVAQVGTKRLEVSDFTLSCDKTIHDVGTYTISVELGDPNYENPSNITAEYEVTPAKLVSVELASDNSVYNQTEVLLSSLSATVMASDGTSSFELDESFTLKCDKTLLNAGEYTITVELPATTNYTDPDHVSDLYKIYQAVVSSLTLNSVESVYNQQTIHPDSLRAVAKANRDTLTLPREAFKLTCDKVMKDADTYSISLQLIDTVNYDAANFVSDKVYTVKKAKVFSMSLDTASKTYDQQVVDAGTLRATVTASEGAITLPETAYNLVCDDTIQNAGTYVISLELIDDVNYDNTANVKDSFVVTKAELSSLALADVSKRSVYNQQAVNPASLTATVKANNSTLVLPEDAYELTCGSTIMNKGEYTIHVKLIDKVNYANTADVTDIYSVDQATLTTLTLTDPGSTYNQQSVDPAMLASTLMASDGTTDLVVDSADYTLTCTEQILNADEYTITVKLNENSNYKDPNAVSAKYTVKKAAVTALTLADASKYSIYSQQEVNPASLNATVTAQGGITLPVSAYNLTCSETILDADEYTIGIKLVDDLNYEDPQSVTDTYTVQPATLSSLVLDADTLESIYSQNAVPVASLRATVKANEDAITLPVEAYELACEKEILTADQYAITVKLVDTKNYVDPNAVTDTYTVHPAKVSSLTLDEASKSSIYDQNEVDPEALTATVKANEGAITLPVEAYKLTCDQSIVDVDEYTITIELIDQVNYVNPDKVSDTFTVKPALVSALILDAASESSIYNQKEVDPEALTATVTANDGDTILPVGAYKLTCDKQILLAGQYTISIELVDQVNYVDTNKVTAVYTVNKATVTGIALDESTSTSIFSQKEVPVASLKATVTANEGDDLVILPVDAYELTCQEKILDARDYAIGVRLLDNDNYQISENSEPLTDTYTVTPAPVQKLTLGVTTLIYDQNEVDLSALQPTAVAQTNGGELITLPYGGEDAAYQVVFRGDETNSVVKNAGAYTLEVALTDSNYQGSAEAAFTVTPAKLQKLTLGVKSKVYDRTAADLTLLEPTVVALTNDDELITLPYGDEDAAYYINGAEAIEVGEYVFAAVLLDELNYEADTDITDTYAILRMPVAPLSLLSNVTNSDGEFVLGGPVAAGNRTITVKGEPGEQITVTVNGVKSDSMKLNENGTATLTITGDGKIGKLVLGKSNELALDGSGAGQAFTVSAAYDDAKNLRDGEEEVAPAAPEQACRYDMEAQMITVDQLHNRGADGILVTLPEDLAEISFTSHSAASIAFSGSAKALVKSGAQNEKRLVPFSGTNKLNSTDLDHESLYDVTFADLVGNTASTLDLEVEKSTATVKIESVDPALNDNKRIGRTDTLTWTITCSGFNDSAEENVRLSIGKWSNIYSLHNGTQTISVPARELQNDTLLNVSIAFEDLEGGGVYEAFVYNDRCYDPLLTSNLYSECYVLVGIAEPGSRVVIRVNGERVDCKIDSFGTFAANMPVVYEGDTVELIVTDLADNTTVVTYVVGPALEKVQMKAYMMGKFYTNARTAKEGEPLDWTMVTAVTGKEIKDGKVVLPIVAGNMIQVGTMTMTMDDKGGISYDYVLDEGVTLLSEDVRVNSTASKEAALNHEGVLLSRNEATRVNTRKDQYYVTAEFVVEVDEELLTSTFQLESAANSELKLIYRDRQNNKPLK